MTKQLFQESHNKAICQVFMKDFLIYQIKKSYNIDTIVPLKLKRIDLSNSLSPEADEPKPALLGQDSQHNAETLS